MSDEANIELLDEVNCHIHGLSTATRRKLYDKYSYFLPYARHTPAYKMGRWDGKEKFFSIGGKTFINLLDEIVEYLISEGYEITLTDNRKRYDISLPEISADYFSHKTWPEGHQAGGNPIILRDDQVEIINNFTSNLNAVQEVATGAGKTLVTAALSSIVENNITWTDPESGQQSPARSIVIVPSKSLVTQTEEDYVNLGLDVGVYYGDRKEFDKTHTICTWQSLESIQKAFKSGKSDLSLQDFVKGVMAVIVDECHGAKADVLKKMMIGPFRNIPVRWGLTGTIPKEDHAAAGIRISIGNIVGKLSAKELQENGILSSCNINIIQLKDDIVYNNYHSEMKYLVSDKERIKFISGFIESIAADNNTLVLVNNISTGNLLVEHLNKDSIIFVSGKMSNEDRKREYDKFKEGSGNVVIATYGVASTGINIVRINNLVLLEPGKSFVRVIQSIGRGLRKGHDKDHVEIYDICSNAKYSRRHLAERKKFYRESQYPFKVMKVDWKV